jgi:sugar (pentulose or hexulose) kinase
MTAIAVLDIGKTNLKVVLFDANANILWEKGAPNAPLLAPPYLHADVDRIGRFVLEALAEGNRRHPISVIVPTAHGASGVVVTEDGLALPMIDYEDLGPEGIEDRYARVRPPFAESLSAPAANGLNLARALAYQKWRFPEEFARGRHILTYPQYWSWWLTGVPASEVTSLGCHTDLWNPQARTFSSVVDALGIRELFPPVLPAWEPLSTHDSNASLLPHLLGRSAPFTVVSSGTWVILMTVGLVFDSLDQASDLYANVDVTGAPVPCARFMGGREYHHIVGDRGESPDAASLARVIASGAMALPSFTGQGGPYASRRGEIIGTVADEDRPALATLHIALMTDDLLTRLGAATGDLIVEGSFGRNAPYCGLLAALRPNQSVRVPADQSGTARGAALLVTWPSKPKLAPDHVTEPIGLFGLEGYRDLWRAMLAVS